MKWFINLKIGVKLIIGFVLVAIIAGIIGVVGFINIQKVDKEYSNLFTNYGNAQGDIAYVYTGFLKQRLSIRDIFLFTDAESRKAKFDKIKAMDIVIEKGLKEYATTTETEEDKAQLKQLTEELKNYRAILTSIEEKLQAKDEVEAKKIFAASLGSGSKTDVFIDKILEFNIVTGNKISDELSKQTIQTSQFLVIFIVIAMILAIVLGLLITSMISKPIKILANASEKLSIGDIDVKIEIDQKDEIGILAKSFIKMVDAIKDQVIAVEKIASGDMSITVRNKSEKDIMNIRINHMLDINNRVFEEIGKASEQVSMAAEQVAQGATSMAQSATEQSSTIEEITATVVEISGQARENAANAREANISANNAKENATVGAEQMRTMVTAMDEINEASAKIAKIIKVIDDIAFQTNILALNAAVEAARAGSHGKGFAVVAEEVRNLAARSAQAAKETTDLIEGTIKKINNGNNIAKETADGLKKIVDIVQNVSDMIEGIATSSGEQATAVAQVSQAVTQISSAVQTNSATAEESAATSEELAGQAMVLRKSISRFKIRGRESNNSFESDFSQEKGLKEMDTWNNIDSTDGFGKY